MTKMKPRRRPSSRQESPLTSGPNWVIIGSIIGISTIALIALAVISSLNPTVAAAPTPVLGETVTNATLYCETNPERCVTVGNPDAEVTMIEVVDYGCPHCAAFNREKSPTLQANYVETDQVRWMVMPYALGALTMPSAAAVMCVNEQSPELALAFHERLFSLQQSGSEHTLGGFLSAGNFVDGLDTDALESCVDDGRHMENVSFNQQAARALGVSSTPAFFLNDRIITGNQDLAVFTERLDAELN
ncbi:MAG: protein-disulfide isomerase [Cellvibrionaceae bacterium]|jgi:protein-disulfide isomerase